MMTFIISTFIKTAKFLDRARLQKQIIEANQILNIISSKKNEWKNHPIVKSWQYFNYNFLDQSIFFPYCKRALQHYINCMIREYIDRGYKTSYCFYAIKCDDCLNLDFSDLDDIDIGCICSDNKYELMQCDGCCEYFRLFLPWWCDWGPYIQSNIASLLIKSPKHYLPLKKKLKFDEYYSDKGYIWPIKINLYNIDKYYLYFEEMKIEARYCQGIIKSGPNKGQVCYGLIKDSKYLNEEDSNLCKLHRKKYPVKFCQKITGKGTECGKKFKTSNKYCNFHTR